LAKFTTPVLINSKGLVVSVGLLLASLVFVVLTIKFNGWKLNTKAGIGIACAYCIFIIGAVSNEKNAHAVAASLEGGH
jgi:Ca2+/Na+ antiporter